MIDRHGRIVDQALPLLRDRETERKLVVNLCARSPQPPIEAKRTDCGASKAHIDTLKQLNVARRTSTVMVVADLTTEPLDHTDDRGLGSERLIFNVIASAHASDGGRIAKVCFDLLHQSGLGAASSSVNETISPSISSKPALSAATTSTRANLDGLQAIRRRRAFEKFARLHVAVAINDDDEIGRSLLPI